jgi:CDP-glycerol glycerophosphotransferase
VPGPRLSIVPVAVDDGSPDHGPEILDELAAPQYCRALAPAKYFVKNVNFANELMKRPGTVDVQTHHGTPRKTMGLDLRHAPPVQVPPPPMRAGA